MTCALCIEKEANKKNTHFLTDGVIRSCLNIEGSKDRERGFYFRMASHEPFVDFNFQRSTPAEKVAESLGRPISDEEVNNAKEIPFSVDYVFCSDCEKLFTEIENRFLADILPRFRNHDLAEQQSVVIEDVVLARLFFYLQIWRSSVCSSTYQLPENIAEHLRVMILNFKTVTENELRSYPLSVTYLETLGGEKAFTENCVGYTNDSNPYIILMNDFVIQLYETPETIRLLKAYGLNAESDYMQYINYQEIEFVSKVINDQDRKNIWHTMILEEKVRPALHHYESFFVQGWVRVFGIKPAQHQIMEYLQTTFGETGFHVLKYSKEQIIERTTDFIARKAGL